MILDNLKNSANIKEDIANLTIEDKKKLMSEIDTVIKEAEAENIKLETILAGLNQERTELVAKAKELEIDGNEPNEILTNLEKAITDLETKINQDIEKYIEVLKGE